jgi:hypothetical protein
MSSELDFLQHILEIDSDKWEIFFQFIPEFEKLKNEINPNSEQYDSRYSELASRFFRQFNALDLYVVFNWMSWTEGNEMLNQKEFDFDSLDIFTLFKLLSLIVRADRFNEGYLDYNIENGNVYRIIQSIKTKLTLAT